MEAGSLPFDGYKKPSGGFQHGDYMRYEAMMKTDMRLPSSATPKTAQPEIKQTSKTPCVKPAFESCCT